MNVKWVLYWPWVNNFSCYKEGEHTWVCVQTGGEFLALIDLLLHVYKMKLDGDLLDLSSLSFHGFRGTGWIRLLLKFSKMCFPY